MILNANQAGEGPPVVLLHGLFGAGRNFGAVQRALAPRFRVVALDMRNHGDSPHDPDMRYLTQAEDVRETMRALEIDKAAIVGHSMGGKAAMAMALRWPESVARLLVADIAPVNYQHGNKAIAEAMASIPMTSSLTRQEADAALAASVPRADIRAFLLQNLRLGALTSLADWLGRDRRGPARPRGLDRRAQQLCWALGVRDRGKFGLRAAGTPADHPRPLPGRPLRRD